MTILEAYIKYREAGIAVHPTKSDKSPLMSTDWKGGFDETAFIGAEGIGIICGKISGNIECLDFDNHFGDAKDRITEYLKIPEVNEIYTKYKLPVEISQNGGFHIVYRCTVINGNRKLAMRLNDKGRSEALIETRGEGGYFCAFPMKGYTVIRNDIFSIATISPTERITLIDCACSFNEVVKNVAHTEQETSGERLGDLYNQSDRALSDVFALLTNQGWVQIGRYGWRRPDKKNGISATLGKVADKIFYVFSSNADPFEQERGYTPFQVLALLKFNGDFKDAARSLVDEFGAKKQQEIELKEPIMNNAKVEEIESLLKRSEIDTTRVIERPPIILSIREQSATQFIYKRLFTLGNFSCIIGKAKSKKTFLLSLMTASILNPDCVDKFNSELHDNKRNVLYFDTEQGEYDCYSVVKRIETLSGGVKMRSFMLREFTPKQRCEIIEYAFKLWGNETGYCVIDGIADLAMAINDEVEATRVSTMLLRLTKQYNCHISTVIHQNKNDNFATGHLGSSIMKKAEILISVTRATDNPRISEVSCDLSRAIDFEKFYIDIDVNGLPYVCDSSFTNKGSRGRNIVPPEVAVGMSSFDYELKMQVEEDAPF